MCTCNKSNQRTGNFVGQTPYVNESINTADGSATATENKISTWGSNLLGIYNKLTGAAPTTTTTDTSSDPTLGVDPTTETKSYTALYITLGVVAFIVVAYFGIKWLKNRKK